MTTTVRDAMDVVGSVRANWNKLAAGFVVGAAVAGWFYTSGYALVNRALASIPAAYRPAPLAPTTWLSVPPDVGGAIVAGLAGLFVAVVLVAALSWACGNMIVKNAGQVDILAFIVWSALFSIPPLVLMAWYFDGVQGIAADLQHASWKAWGVVLWQSVGNTLIGYGLWNLLLNRYSAAIVTPWALLVPVFGMSASALLLAEPLPWWKLLAMVLIVAGLALNMLANRK